ncbi:hypothetical protein [Halanaeroarchaeum sulfurireducens]|uniref:Uncharacterized protein n=1 Tax=Halanaeroarchaeum sulfurireducens TaxID=1604004 RepID=A0A0F7PCK0_9EURY|nr:hypothetical protein [Halanaeroarchaeum sulfurireducens]AKH97905.1 hypothetical protein HLASF_1422 [Halanaeroarchaeum sulfurireducens]ALG82299.1 hypothetical protein HLASA_1409 [Halanaeroarchaeum sulfurireducens]
MGECPIEPSASSTTDGGNVESAIDRVLADIRPETVHRDTRADRDEHRDINDALAEE